jgi:aryl-alcohol dehydrogenase-like predicted oxidoreductase
MTSNGVAASGAFTLGDLTVNRLGFGAMRITGEGIWGEPRDPEQCRRVLRRSLELGVNLIDTANSYGPEVSERMIGETLSPYHDGLVIATKGGFTRPGPNRWVADGRPEALREAIEGSLARLKLERIDLHQFHTPDRNVPFADSVRTFAELQKEGKIRHVGLSNVNVAQIEEARGIVPIVSVQNRYNAEDRSSEDVLQYCEREGIGFIPWAPVGGKGSADSTSPIARIAVARGTSPSQVALAWLLRQSPVMLPIPGTSSVAHLEENCAAGDLALTDDEFAQIDAMA